MAQSPEFIYSHQIAMNEEELARAEHEFFMYSCLEIAKIAKKQGALM